MPSVLLGALLQRGCTYRWSRALSRATSHSQGALHHLHQDAQVPEPWISRDVPIQQAVTLPASWYTDPRVFDLEKQRVLTATWQMVGHTGQLQNPGDFFTGSLLNHRYVVVRSNDGHLRAFRNVCRHHAAAVASGCGRAQRFECPYHGWTYDLQGRLVKATRLKGIQGFKAADYGLHPIRVDQWGPLIFLHLGGRAVAGKQAPSDQVPGVAEWLGSGGRRLLEELGVGDPLVHVARREYVLRCNWKVFCDNYLDGGYHVSFAHKDLAAQLDLDSYRSELYEVLSLQLCLPGASQQQQQQQHQEEVERASNGSSSGDSAAGRLTGGRDAAYAFIFPNLMINRYGPWMDTNVVIPLDNNSTDRCRVVFDWWLTPDALLQAQQQHGAAAAATAATSAGTAGAAAAGGDAYSASSAVAGAGAASVGAGAAGSIISAPTTTTTSAREPATAAPTNGDAAELPLVVASLAASHQVQVEDVALCEAVQAGLEDPSYGVGRYAPGVEAPMFHFHCMLHDAVVGGDTR